jgi:hypothetical protein
MSLAICGFGFFFYAGSVTRARVGLEQGESWTISGKSRQKSDSR